MPASPKYHSNKDHFIGWDEYRLRSQKDVVAVLLTLLPSGTWYGQSSLLGSRLAFLRPSQLPVPAKQSASNGKVLMFCRWKVLEPYVNGAMGRQKLQTQNSTVQAQKRTQGFY